MNTARIIDEIAEASEYLRRFSEILKWEKKLEAGKKDK